MQIDSIIKVLSISAFYYLILTITNNMHVVRSFKGSIIQYPTRRSWHQRITTATSLLPTLISGRYHQSEASPSAYKPNNRFVHQKAAPRDSLEETGKTGEFVRRDAAWRNWISEDADAKFPPESGRYHLICAYACPWAHRTLMTRSMKGLQDVISVSIVHPIWQKTRPKEDDHRGWVFGKPNGGEPMTNVDGRGGPFPTAYDDNLGDPLFDFGTVRDFYEFAGDQEGKYSVPILWDKKLNTIVSNESAEIIRMLNTEFNKLSPIPELDLYPEEIREYIDAANEWIYPKINNGVYRCGFAKTQAAYDVAIQELTEAFDRVDEILQQQRYIAGDKFTEADNNSSNVTPACKLYDIWWTHNAQ